MNRTITATAIAAGAAILTAAPALAGTAYMDGLGNVGPRWSTITAPAGQTCGAGCNELRYDYFSTQSAARAAGAWMDANNTPDSVLFTFSLSTTGAIDARAARPDWQGTIVALGSPAKPNNGRTYAGGGRPVLDVAGGDITFVTAQGDSQTQKSGGSFLTHLNGYSDRNFQTETPITSTQPAPNVTDNLYASSKPRPATAAPAALSWSERAEIARAERAERRAAAAERAEARKTARAERRAESRARWTSFVDRLAGKADSAADAGDQDAEPADNDAAT